MLPVGLDEAVWITFVDCDLVLSGLVGSAPARSYFVAAAMDRPELLADDRGQQDFLHRD